MQYLATYFKQANRYNYAGSLVWEIYADVPENAFLLSYGSESYPGYNFQYRCGTSKGLSTWVLCPSNDLISCLFTLLWRSYV